MYCLNVDWTYIVSGTVCKIPCKNCDSDYVGETGRTYNIRWNEHRKAYRKGDLSSKLVIHYLETDHKPDFDNLQITITEFSWRGGSQGLRIDAGRLRWR